MSNDDVELAGSMSLLQEALSPSSPNPFSLFGRRGAEPFQSPSPSLGEGFRVRAKVTCTQLARFAENLQQEVISNAEGNQTEEDGGAFREEAFTRLMIEYLTEAGELEDGHVCYHTARGIKVNGYNLQEEEGRLDLFISIYTQSPLPTTVRKDAVEGAFKQLINFLSKVS
jgi:hypothetical protein